MKMFKTKHGSDSEVYEISRYTYEKVTKLREPYVQTGKDLRRRHFAVCPACDNPIQMVGLYQRDPLSKHAFGKHYNREVKGLAPHNQQAYMLCPYSSKKWITPEKGARKTNVTEFEKDIYQTVKKNFDLIMFILRSETGIFLTENYARHILSNYVFASGWMYPWATLYNIPWMVLYLCGGIPILNERIRKDSDLAKAVTKENKCYLAGYKLLKDYKPLRSDIYADINFMLHNHRRSVRNGMVMESIMIEVAGKKEDRWETLFEKKLNINEYRFINLINSKEAEKRRSEKYLELAERIMYVDL